MDIARRRVFYEKQDFQLAWEGLGPRRRFLEQFRRNSHVPREAISEAGHFLGGALLADGFQIFKNGGIPLLERRTGPLIEEIVLRASPTICDEPFVPLRVYLHLSHSGLQDVRLRYWRPASRAPSYLACLDLGQLELPPCWVIWNVGLSYEVLLDLHDWVRRLAIPWFNLFEDSVLLRQMLYQRMVSGIDLDRSLELILAQYGPIEAMRFLEECVMRDSEMGPMIRDASRRIRGAVASGGMGADQIWNIATIASAHSLL